jgi:hypothetical protein
MMEENNRKGPGVFYAVVGVATLVVAIIGATFAYFSASTDNSEDPITGSIAEAGGISLKVDSLTNTGADMIPLNLIDGTSQLTPAMSGKCVDDNGNHVCDVYKITLTNDSKSASIDIRGEMKLTSESVNLKWQLLNVTDEDFAAEAFGDAAMADAIAVNATGQLVRPFNDTYDNTTEQSARTKLGAGLSEDFYVLIWLEETGDKQELDDAGEGFTGLVTFNAVDATGTSSGITASFRQA